LGYSWEGEAFLLAGAFLAHRGYFSLLLVILVAIAANTLGGQFLLSCGASSRPSVVWQSRFGGSPRFRRILAWMSSYGNWVLLLSRFAFGFRIVIPAACARSACRSCASSC